MSVVYRSKIQRIERFEWKKAFYTYDLQCNMRNNIYFKMFLR